MDALIGGLWWPGPADCETGLMLDFESGTFVELDPGFTPSPSDGGLCLLQQEETHDGYLIISGYVPGLRAPDRQQASALATIIGMIQSVFGFPMRRRSGSTVAGSSDTGSMSCEGRAGTTMSSRTTSAPTAPAIPHGRPQLSTGMPAISSSARRTTRPSSWRRACGSRPLPTGRTRQSGTKPCAGWTNGRPAARSCRQATPGMSGRIRKISSRTRGPAASARSPS